MKKKKVLSINVFPVLVLLVCLIYVLATYKVRSERVLSYNSGNGNGYGYGNNNNNGNQNNYNDNNNDNDDEDDAESKQESAAANSQPTIYVSVYPSYITTPTYTQPTIQVTSTPVLTPVAPTESISEKNDAAVEQKEKEINQNESSGSEVVVVSVAERSVITSDSVNINSPIAAPTKSIFKKIESKIKNVGGSGQFLSRPKKTPTPTLAKKEDDINSPVALGPDSSIFYMLTDTDLLVGAVDREDKRINVDEAELRGAEITMNKVLAKKGLELGVSSGGSLVLTENGVRTYFDLPVFIDVFSHEISVDTANGKKQIKTTPAKAVVNAIESGYLENVDRKAQMTMGTVDGGELVYRLEGDKEFNVFGRIRTKGVQYVYVDVETGEVEEGDQPLLSKLLELISL